MRGVDRRAGEGTPRSLFGPAIALLLLLITLAIGVPAGVASAAPQPAATASPVATPASSSPSPGLSLDLGSLHVNVTLPVDLTHLLPVVKTSTTRPAPRPSTTVPAHQSTAAASHAAYPPTAPQITQPGPARSHAHAFRPPRPHAHHHPGTTPSPKPSPRPTPHPSHSRDTVVFAHSILPGTGPLILIVLCVACGLAVAIVVRVTGGRRRV